MLPFVRWTVLGFSLILLLAGVMPFLNAGSSGPTSSAHAYAAFHLLSALIGFASVTWRRGQWTPWFALLFGAADLYQWVASLAGWFPQHLFRWTPVDDGLHLGLGLGLVALGAASVFFAQEHR